jgi:hypothetical protein
LVLFIVKYITDKQLEKINIDYYNIERRVWIWMFQIKLLYVE